MVERCSLRLQASAHALEPLVHLDQLLPSLPARVAAPPSAFHRVPISPPFLPSFAHVLSSQEITLYNSAPGHKTGLALAHEIVSADFVEGNSLLAVVYIAKRNAQLHQAIHEQALVCSVFRVTDGTVQWEHDALMNAGGVSLPVISAKLISGGAAFSPIRSSGNLRFFDCATREVATIDAESFGLFEIGEPAWGRRWGNMLVVGNLKVAPGATVQIRMRLLTA